MVQTMELHGVDHGFSWCRPWIFMVRTMDFQDARHRSAPYCVSAGIFAPIHGDLLSIGIAASGSNSGFQDFCGLVEDSEGCR